MTPSVMQLSITGLYQFLGQQQLLSRVKPQFQ